jgi:probable phosphoglycerate mutase
MIYLLRHGQTEHNVAQRIQGRCDSPLTELGKAQARAMGAKLRGLIGDDAEFAIVASPLPRALASAELVREAAGINPPIVTDERLQEVGCGSWEKHHFETLARRDPLIGEAPCFLAAWAHYCSDGEGLDAALLRLSGWLGWAEGRKLVVVGHGVAGSLLRGFYASLGRDELTRLRSAPQDRFHRLHEGTVEEILCSVSTAGGQGDEEREGS